MEKKIIDYYRESIMFFKYLFTLVTILTLTGCTTVGDVYDWAFDKDEEIETVITNENKSQFEYVTVNIKDKIAIIGFGASGYGTYLGLKEKGFKNIYIYNFSTLKKKMSLITGT